MGGPAAPVTRVHGALLEVHQVGVLLRGRSGIGKSECALELVSRGHRLVADDVVELETAEGGRVIGRSPERIRHHMEIRGLGILYIPDLFGPDSVVESVSVGLVCELEQWREGAHYDRLGLERTGVELLGIEIPRLVLPARPGGSMATVVEVGAREHRRRQDGVNSAARLDARLRREMDRP
jgi:HPr kinase/phosphorylase